MLQFIIIVTLVCMAQEGHASTMASFKDFFSLDNIKTFTETIKKLFSLDYFKTSAQYLKDQGWYSGNWYGDSLLFNMLNTKMNFEQFVKQNKSNALEREDLQQEEFYFGRQTYLLLALTILITFAIFGSTVFQIYTCVQKKREIKILNEAGTDEEMQKISTA